MNKNSKASAEGRLVNHALGRLASQIPINRFGKVPLWVGV